MSSKFKGTGVAMITPYDEKNKVDFNAISNLIELFIESKISYIVVLGTTSEYPCLTKEEKNEIVEFVKIKINKKIPIVLGLGGNNTEEVIKSIEQTNFDGIDAILTVAPYYNKPNQDGLFAHFSEIAKKSPVDIILYNVPGRTAVNILPETVIKLANKFKNIIAVKEASGNVEQIMKIINEKPKNLSVISGDDALTLPLISVGVEGVISVAANAFPKEFAKMVNFALNKNFEEANKIHYQFLNSINLMFEEGNPVGIKCFMNELGIINNKNVRLPLVPASETLLAKIRNFIIQL
ncbi:MAG: 4-hydroxy-tetrahydrodipicolinate synthase [Bacteroidales bacterium]|jgi:4-hydroxy-tetrahydrodipicolinate synthase|nr:4-hydroxy-tetrahydrodipicolinate synthase [Bacteroidales bacterium]